MPFCLVQLTYYLPLNTTDDMILDAISNPEYIFYYMLFGMDLRSFAERGQKIILIYTAYGLFTPNERKAKATLLSNWYC